MALVVLVLVFGGLVAAGLPVLGAIALPLLSMKTALTGIESVKLATPAVTVAHALNDRFGDNTDPAVSSVAVAQPAGMAWPPSPSPYPVISKAMPGGFGLGPASGPRRTHRRDADPLSPGPSDDDAAGQIELVVTLDAEATCPCKRALYRELART